MKLSLKDRLLSHVTRNENGCWVCDLAKVGIGYAKITIKGRSYRAHRISYELFNGEIPTGMFVLHDCDNPSCINPEHLHLGTQTENMRERSKRGRAPVGEKNNKTKLSIEDVLKIKKALYAGRSMRSLAREYCLAKNSIANIRDGKSWKGISENGTK